MRSTSKKSSLLNFINNMRPWHRLLLSLIITAIVALLTPKFTEQLFYIMLIWITFAITYLLISWVIVFYRPVDDIRKHANIDDGSKVFVFLMIMGSSFAGLLIVLLIMLSPVAGSHNISLFLIVTISGMMLSWVLVHTIFIFHYAHMYYDDLVNDNTKFAEGLVFPENKSPDYIDFAYFSFVIGCTFQVSDVIITSRKMRHMVLIHGLLSFALNTFVVALTINLIGGLGK